MTASQKHAAAFERLKAAHRAQLRETPDTSKELPEANRMIERMAYAECARALREMGKVR